MNENRRFSRVQFDAECALNLDGKSFATEMVDISLKGVLLKRPDAWNAPNGSLCKFTMKLGGGDVVISMDVKLARVIPEGLGFETVHIDLDSITHLRRLVELNVGDSTLIERELAAMTN
ncbi:MAG: PilZ domain-containing protein [Deltaproteobacteria bacterium]|nr:PilZ domain-containing protein [Deltaproteobacteria bacterium]